MKKVTVWITEKQMEKINELIENGTYANMSETVRDAVRMFLKRGGNI